MTLILFLTISHSLEARKISSIESKCFNLFFDLMGKQRDSLGANLLLQEKIRQFIDNEISAYGKTSLMRDHIVSLFSKMEDSMIQALFFKNGQLIPLHLSNKRLELLYPENSLGRIRLKEFYDELSRSSQKDWPSLKKKLGAANEKLKSFLPEIELRTKLHKLEAEADKISRYEIIVEGDTITLPNKETFEIVRKNEDQSLIILMPANKIIKTQAYINTSIVTQYIKDKALKKMSFGGRLTAHGHFFILDQHHRVTAYAKSISKNIPVEIISENGRYYTQSYLASIKFFGIWQKLKREKRIEILEKFIAGQESELKSLLEDIPRYQ